MASDGGDDSPLRTKRPRETEPDTGTSPGVFQEVIDVDATEDDMEHAADIAEPPDESDEDQETGKPGRPRIILMNSVIRKYTVLENDIPSPRWGCISEKCTYSGAGAPGTARVYKHAGTCRHLASSHPELYRAVCGEQADTAPTARLKKLEQQLSEPPLKKRKGNSGQPSSSSSQLTLEAFARRGAAQNRVANQQKLQLAVDRAVMLLICNCGVAPSIIDSAEWKAVCHELNPSYHPTSSSTFTDNYIPKEAALVRQQQSSLLSSTHNITISFDGNNTRLDGIYFVHATTPAHESFFVDGHVGTEESHTAEWIATHVEKSIKTIGADRIAALASDGAANCVLAKSLLVQRCVPLAFDLYDCCHSLHGAVKDITQLPYFEWMIKLLKPLITHFSKSNHSRALLSTTAQPGEKIYAIQKIGKTRFSSHYMAAKSVSDVFTNVRDLTAAQSIKFSNKKLQAMLSQRYSTEFKQMECRMENYTAIIEPFARSIWSLESSRANPADVYVFYGAIASHLCDLFKQPPETSGIPLAIAEEVVNLFNDRFDAMFDDKHDIYFVAFALDPRYPMGDMLLIVETAPPSITIPRQGTNLDIPHPRAYDRVKEWLKPYLRKLLERTKEVLALPEEKRANIYVPPVLCTLTAREAAEALKTQLESFWRHRYPFDKPFIGDDPVKWWRDLEDSPHANVLAMLAIRVLSVLPNSMPDERTGSTFTWLNSALRGCQKPNTLIDMVQIRQWYRREAARKTKASAGKPPTVKFRDVKADLLKRTQGQSRLTRKGVADSDESGDDGEAAGSSADSAPVTDAAHGSSAPAVASKLRAAREMNLSSLHLRDMLSDKPLVVPEAPAAAAPVRMDVDEEADWDF